MTTAPIAPRLIFYSEQDPAEAWAAALTTAWPELDVRVWPDTGDVDAITLALVFRPPRGFFRPFPGLKLITNLGAGVDAIIADPTLPEGVPVARLVDPGMTQMMVSYVLLAVLRHHRDFPLFEAATREGRWRYAYPRANTDRPVAILGLGHLGAAAAKALAGLGFPVSGWSRTAKSIEGIRCFHGADGLSRALDGAEIIVALLPSTPATRGLINHAMLASAAPGAAFINVGRGDTVNEPDLVRAIADGHIAAATLDVFETEPLPDDHPFRARPEILVTPHVASVPTPETAAPQIVEKCKRALAGETVLHRIDPARGY